MPLHLLGKKSWNVYNADNIAKVKQDEAEAAAREAAQEQRDQEVDARRRMRILRGEEVKPLPPAEEACEDAAPSRREGSGRERKRKRIAGEDDTDRDIRFALEDQALAVKRANIPTQRKQDDAPLADPTGHINLFPSQQNGSELANSNPARAKDRKQNEKQDQSALRFANAAGFAQTVQQTPWYHSSQPKEASGMDSDLPSKDVWGNEDPGRRQRERSRIVADDPLSVMQKGAAAVRQAESERAEWRREKTREIDELTLIALLPHSILIHIIILVILVITDLTGTTEQIRAEHQGIWREMVITVPGMRKVTVELTTRNAA